MCLRVGWHTKSPRRILIEVAARKKNGSVGDLTVEILKQIRDGVRATNERLDQTNARLDGMNQRLDRHELILVHQGTMLERHEQLLELHGKALTKLIGAVEGLNDRFDNFLTGAHREEHAELVKRVRTIEEWIAARAS